MKRLSPTDPYRLRIICHVSFRPDYILSRFTKRLLEHGIRSIRVFEREVEFALTRPFSIINDTLALLDNILSSASNNIDTICMEAYLVSKNISDRIRDFINKHRVKCIETGPTRTCIVVFDNSYTWVYINTRANKVVVKKILGRIINPDLIDPSIVPESLFITCSSSWREVSTRIRDVLGYYRRLVEAIA